MIGCLQIRVTVLVFVLLIFGRPIHAQDLLPLHQQIDALVAETQVGPNSGLADDATFVRRVYLDFLGKIPSQAQTLQFLNDDSPDKRTTLVEQLAASPEFNAHLATVFDVMLMERRGGKYVKSEQFRDYLEESFRADKSFRELSREILAADGTAANQPAAAAFYLEREVTADLLTREIGRVFFGVDLQCAQCHDHPNIDDYDQEDYYGIKAFVLRASLFRPDKKKPALISESAAGEATFQSVFTDRSGSMAPRLPGTAELIEVKLNPVEQYVTAPEKTVRGIPKVSRIELLAESIGTKPSLQFSRNITNRLWAHMFGRGLVHPVDLHHSDNPPSHPQLLEQLARSFEELDYDVKAFVKQIALSKTYQRSSEFTRQAVAVEQAQAQIDALTKEADLAREASFELDSRAAAEQNLLDEQVSQAEPLKKALQQANKTVTTSMKAEKDARQKLLASQTQMSAKDKQKQTLAEALTALQAAVGQFPKDTDVANAAAAIQKKSTAVDQEIAVLKSSHDKLDKALTTATENLKQAQATADKAIAALEPAEEKIRQQRAKMFAVRKQAAQKRLSASIAKSKAAKLQTIAEYQHHAQQIESTQTELTSLSAAIEKKSAEALTTKAALMTATAGLKQAQKAYKNRLQDVAEVENELAELANTEKLFANSLNLLAEASGRIETPESLNSATTAIETERKAIVGKLANSKVTLTKLQAEAASMQQASGTASANVKSVSEKLDATTAELKKLKDRHKAATASLAKHEQQLPIAWDAVVEQSAIQLNTMQISQLTPEQFGWSVLVATGRHAQQIAAQTAKRNKEKPLSDEDKQNPAKLADWTREVENAAFKASGDEVAKFVKLFGAGSGQPQDEFFATADQALFLANGPELRGWLSPSGTNLTARVIQLPDPASQAQELYLTLFSRKANPDEVAAVTDYLQGRDDVATAVQEIAWGLITSAEFRFRY